MAEKLFCQHIEHRQHQRAEERAGKAPAEGRHAKETHAKTEDQFSQRRVGDLVGLHVVDMLKGSARMVDLVEIAAVEI